MQTFWRFANVSEQGAECLNKLVNGNQQGGIVRETARKRKHSKVATDERLASSRLIRTDSDTPRKRPRNTSSDMTPAIEQDASTSGEHLPHSARFQAGNRLENTGNFNRSPDASAGATASSLVTGTYEDMQSATVQDASTSGEGPPPGTDTPTAFECPICLDTSFRQDQIKRLRCSHVFHQSCIDKWLYNNRSCPLCRALYRRLRAHRNRRHNRNRRPRRNRRLLL
ncbi:hypothetical protein AVEN_212194-1 [Araneus ventricosus]|uniref:RING-type domain-containing protein n=1 Tax=Araneus ventricosus TaxID=182803 RepID=A0A4Y2VTX1_ARAVE|nr:hypothetical protein AVEN_212194-1 [Araneus ventricosus]